MGHSRTWLTRALAMPVAVAVTLLLPLGSVASAQDFEDDADTSVAAAATTPISFTELGRGTDIVFSSDDATRLGDRAGAGRTHRNSRDRNPDRPDRLQ